MTTTKITVDWPALTFKDYSIVDMLFSGVAFAQVRPDPRLANYELEYQTNDSDKDEWFSLGKLTLNSAVLNFTFERAVRVRVRAMLRSGVSSAWETSRWLALYGFTSDFRDYRNTSFYLGII